MQWYNCTQTIFKWRVQRGYSYDIKRLRNNGKDDVIIKSLQNIVKTKNQLRNYKVKKKITNKGWQTCLLSYFALKLGKPCLPALAPLYESV